MVVKHAMCDNRAEISQLLQQYAAKGSPVDPGHRLSHCPWTPITLKLNLNTETFGPSKQKLICDVESEKDKLL
jgi:hypothetical protein